MNREMTQDGLKCGEIRAAFGDYLDGDMSGRAMQAVGLHLEGCADCAGEFAAERGLQQVLAASGPVKMPADLGLKLRLAISHEAARKQTLRDNVAMQWENLVRPLLLQTASGLACAAVLFGGITLFTGFVPASNEVLAHDEPLGAVTMPHFLYSAAPGQPVETRNDSTIVVQADVNTAGQIYDWNVISGDLDAVTRAKIENTLMLQVYSPATMFGEPVRGRVLVTFSGILVRG
jgi:hypothetical protein